MDKRYSKKGLAVIGVEIQGSSKDAIETIAKEYRIKFPITQSVSGPSTGMGIPRVVVFDATGKMIYMGHPEKKEFEKSVKQALKNITKPTNEDHTSSLLDKPKSLIEEKSWTNTDGNTMIAEVIGVDGDQVHFKLSSGKKVKYPVAKLSQEDQELIKKSQEATSTVAE